MRKRLGILFAMVFAAVIFFALSSSVFAAPPSPVLVDVNPYGAEGDWYIGATPPYCKPSSPVIVFVQGLNGNATNWWGSTVYSGTNDMYTCAYNSGYRTAFVNFRDADGNAGSMWLNGSVLRNQLERICTYFGVSKVNMVCHSKGGIDTQSAIVHYGAYKYVDKVFTLSTPHWGSQLADLAYSWYAGWLADLLGSKGDGTYVLQTGYMSYFRSITDSRSENNGVTYYTSAGTNWGPWFSSLWFGGSYLSAYGSNDGLVTVASAKNPRATHINTGDLNHDNIRLGSKVWWYVQPRIGTLTLAQAKQYTAYAASAEEDMAENTGNYLLRGGQIKNSGSISVPVESGLNKVTFDLMMAIPGVIVSVVAPDGTVYVPQSSSVDNNFFSGATHYVTTVENPKSGKWNIKIDSGKDNAYLLMTCFDAASPITFSADKRWAKVNNTVKLGISPNGEKGKKLKDLKVKGNLSKVTSTGKASKVFNFAMDKKDSGLEKNIVLPYESGLYNYNIDVEGTLEDGTPFERTIVQSIFVESVSASKQDALKRLTDK